MITGVRVVIVAALLITGCGAKLPDPESAGGRLYAARCNSCHRLYAPASLKFEMWKVQVERMQGEMARRGVPPLTVEESAVLLDYLKRFSG